MTETTTIVTSDEMISKTLAQYRLSDAAIAELREKYLPLKVSGVDDKKGFEIVKAARINVKNLRVQVEKKRVDLKADALKFGRAVDAEAKRLTELLTPIEDHLTSQEEIITKEQERIAAIEAQKKKEKLDQRMAELQKYNPTMPPSAVEMLNDTEFAGTLFTAKVAFEKAEEERRQAAEAERKQREAEAEARRIENERMAKERAELEAARREAQKAEEARQAAAREEQAKLTAERAAIELERRRVEAERMKAEAEQRAIQEAADRKRREEEAAARHKAEMDRIAAEAEAMKPEKEKVSAFVQVILTLPRPESKYSNEIDNILNEARRQIFALYK